MAEEVKSGVKTSEFWLTVVAMAVGPLSAFAAWGYGQPTVAAILGGVTLIAPMLYIVARSWVKAEREKKIDLLSEEWEDRIGTIVDSVEKLTDALGKKE